MRSLIMSDSQCNWGQFSTSAITVKHKHRANEPLTVIKKGNRESGHVFGKADSKSLKDCRMPDPNSAVEIRILCPHCRENERTIRMPSTHRTLCYNRIFFIFGYGVRA